MSSSIIPAAEISAGALDAERARLDIVAQNLANMNTTRGSDGQVYRRKLVTFESVMKNVAGQNTDGASVRVSKITEDQRPLTKVYMPGHPHADEKGMVTMPNVNMIEEMSDMMVASRSYDANLQVLKTGRQMLTGAIDVIGGVK